MTTSIAKEHTFTGRWSRVGGTVRNVHEALKFTPADGGHLQLEGLFERDAGFGEALSSDQYTIHGVSNTGQDVTLFKARLRGETLSSRYRVSEYRSSIIAIGGHFSSYEALRFRTVAAAYDNLEAVLGLSGISETHSRSEDP